MLLTAVHRGVRDRQDRELGFLSLLTGREGLRIRLLYHLPSCLGWVVFPSSLRMLEQNLLPLPKLRLNSAGAPVCAWQGMPRALGSGSEPL